MDLSMSTDWSYCGLRAVVMENRHLRIVILPDAGAKIWQITHRPTDTDLLWNNPRMPPARLAMNSRYDDVWSSSNLTVSTPSSSASTSCTPLFFGATGAALLAGLVSLIYWV